MKKNTTNNGSGIDNGKLSKAILRSRRWRQAVKFHMTESEKAVFVKKSRSKRNRLSAILDAKERFRQKTESALFPVVDLVLTFSDKAEKRAYQTAEREAIDGIRYRGEYRLSPEQSELANRIVNLAFLTGFSFRRAYKIGDRYCRGQHLANVRQDDDLLQDLTQDVNFAVLYLTARYGNPFADLIEKWIVFHDLSPAEKQASPPDSAMITCLGMISNVTKRFWSKSRDVKKSFVGAQASDENEDREVFNSSGHMGQDTADSRMIMRADLKKIFQQSSKNPNRKMRLSKTERAVFVLRFTEKSANNPAMPITLSEIASKVLGKDGKSVFSTPYGVSVAIDRAIYKLRMTKAVRQYGSLIIDSLTGKSK